MQRIRLAGLIRRGIASVFIPDPNPYFHPLLPGMTQEEIRMARRDEAIFGVISEKIVQTLPNVSDEDRGKILHTVRACNIRSSVKVLATGRLITHYINRERLMVSYYYVSACSTRFSRLEDALQEAGLDVQAYLSLPS